MTFDTAEVDWVHRFLVALAISLTAFACGPSFQAVYECELHFEHCYALEQGGASPGATQSCWSDWLRNYTYGQPRDRIEYATARARLLSGAPASTDGDAGLSASLATVATPMPTNAFAPPPNVSDGRDTNRSADAGAPRQAARAGTPGAECAEDCADPWSACRASCKTHPCVACDRVYRACMSGCFRDDGPQRPPSRPRP